MIETIKRYPSLDEAQKSTSRRSFDADRLGIDSKFEVRAVDFSRHETEFFGGPAADFEISPLKDAEVVATYSRGYKC